MRDFYLAPRHVTQGSIINCCISSNYANSSVDGIIITPRCDLAHEGKVYYVHYLPIVDFKEWFLYDGKKYLYSRWYLKRKEKFFDLCKRYSLPNCLNKKDLYEQMALKVVPQNNYHQFLDVLNNYFSASYGCAEFIQYLTGKEAKKQIVKNLLQDNLPAFYLLDNWEKNKSSYKVILLRELRRISFSTIMRIDGGIECKSINKQEDELEVEGDLCFVQTQVASPFMEHIMQRFSYNFCRIGVDDRNFTSAEADLGQLIDEVL